MGLSECEMQTSPSRHIDVSNAAFTIFYLPAISPLVSAEGSMSTPPSYGELDLALRLPTQKHRIQDQRLWILANITSRSSLEGHGRLSRADPSNRPREMQPR